jgi:anti-sigma-K factor RskA
MMPDHAQPDHTDYADWDAAYVLGALSPTERKEFESHLETCERCRAGVAELSGLPGLLGRLDPSRAFALLEPSSTDDLIPTPPADLVARIEKREAVRRTRRTRRTRLLVGVAAAAVVASAVVIPVSIASAPHPSVTTALSQVVASPLSAEVKLTTVGWGTKVDMSCSYGAAADGTPRDTTWDYSLWVVDASGAASELSSWSAKSDSTVNLMAGTALPVGKIAQVQIRSAEDGTVLLASDLH